MANIGWLKGSTASTKWTNQTYYKFLGIPYAEAPSGARRFKVNLLQHRGHFLKFSQKKKFKSEIFSHCSLQFRTNHGSVCEMPSKWDKIVSKEDLINHLQKQNYQKILKIVWIWTFSHRLCLRIITRISPISRFYFTFMVVALAQEAMLNFQPHTFSSITLFWSYQIIGLMHWVTHKKKL